MLIVITAPSGTGKTTIVRNVMKEYSDIIFSVSATTRQRRGKEEDGIDYFFLSKEEFEKKIANNEFVEYEKIFDNNYYGTLKSFVDDNLKNGRDVFFDVDVLGALSIKKCYKEKAVTIFIKPPSKEEIKRRLIERHTESMEQIERRLSRYDNEMAKIKEFDYIVLNDNLESAVNEVKKIIKKYKNKGELNNAD